jgi:hypothetical protein
MLRVSMVRYPWSAVRLAYLPKMNAFRVTFEVEGIIGMAPWWSDSNTGTIGANKRMQVKIPSILVLMVVFPPSIKLCTSE